jgi:hypothetical protein
MRLPAQEFLTRWFFTVGERRRETVLNELRVTATRLARLREHTEAAEVATKDVIRKMEAGEI